MAWTSRNVGIDTLVVNYITQKPSTMVLDSMVHELWAATFTGIFHTINGGRQWAKIELPAPSNAEVMIAPDPTVDDIEFIWIDYDPTNWRIIYSVAAHKSGPYMWAYKTSDSGLSWISRGWMIPDS